LWADEGAAACGCSDTARRVNGTSGRSENRRLRAVALAEMGRAKGTLNYAVKTTQRSVSEPRTRTRVAALSCEEKNRDCLLAGRRSAATAGRDPSQRAPGVAFLRMTEPKFVFPSTTRFAWRGLLSAPSVLSQAWTIHRPSDYGYHDDAQKKIRCGYSRQVGSRRAGAVDGAAASKSWGARAGSIQRRSDSV